MQNWGFMELGGLYEQGLRMKKHRMHVENQQDMQTHPSSYKGV